MTASEQLAALEAVHEAVIAALAAGLRKEELLNVMTAAFSGFPADASTLAAGPHEASVSHPPPWAGSSVHSTDGGPPVGE